jgi:hypothetical protein
MRLTYREKLRWKFHHSRFGFLDFQNSKNPRKIPKIPENPEIPKNPKSAFSPLLFSFSIYTLFFLNYYPINQQSIKKQS